MDFVSSEFVPHPANVDIGLVMIFKLLNLKDECVG